MEKGKYVLYAITDHGNGQVSKVGEYDDPEEIEIFISTFDKEVKLEIVYEKTKS